MANTKDARRTMIDMICHDDNVTVHDVNAAIKADGSSIEPKTFTWIKANCDWFKKYPELKKEHIQQPFVGDQFTKVTKCLENGGHAFVCFQQARK